jgi:hypothetical protein
VVGGELSAVGEVLLDPLREQVHRHAIPVTARGLEIVPGVLGPRAEVLGTLALVLTSDSPAEASGDVAASQQERGEGGETGDERGDDGDGLEAVHERPAEGARPA